MRLVVVQATGLCARFRRKSATSKDQTVQKFLTHVSVYQINFAKRLWISFAMWEKRLLVRTNHWNIQITWSKDHFSLICQLKRLSARQERSSGGFLVSVCFKLLASITNYNPSGLHLGHYYKALIACHRYSNIPENKDEEHRQNRNRVNHMQHELLNLHITLLNYALTRGAIPTHGGRKLPILSCLRTQE